MFKFNKNMYLMRYSLEKINSILFVSYIFIPILFHFISGYIKSYLLEYLITFILVVISLYINRKGFFIRKIILILIIYIFFHLSRVILVEQLIPYQLLKKIIYHGIIALYFLNNSLNYDFLEKVFYKFSIYSFYIFYIEFIFFNDSYIKNTNYMVLGFNLMLPMCIFLFNFLLKGFKKIDLFYFMCLFLTIIFYGNRSPILIVVVVLYLFLMLNKNILKFYQKIILFITPFVLLLKVKSLIFYLYSISYFKEVRILRKFYDFYLNTGTGLLAGREKYYKIYVNDIKKNPIIGNNIKSQLVEAGEYSHNIFLDILHNNGIILGVIIIITIVIFIMKKLKKENDVLFLSIFCMNLTLFFSSFYLQYRYFYILIVLCFLYKNYNCEK